MKKPLIAAILIVLAISCALTAVFAVKGTFSHVEPPPEPENTDVLTPQTLITPEPPKKPEVLPEVSFSMSFFGDLLMHNVVFQAARTEDGYDFTNQLDDIAPYLKRGDFIAGNLETTFAGEAAVYSNYPNFNCPEQLGVAFRDVLGGDFLSTANNHCMDKGIKGLISTINYLEGFGIGHAGTYKSQEDAKETYIKDIKGVKVAVNCYTYGLNGYELPEDYPFAVNLIDKDKIKADAEGAISQGADMAVVFIHWGTEYMKKPSDEQRELARWIFENTDVSLIIGSHPHVVEPIEEITVEKDGKTKTGVVAYSLGNFTGAQKTPNTDSGIIARAYITFNRETGAHKVDKVAYIPTYIDRNDGADNFRIVNITRAIHDYEAETDKFITLAEYERMKKLKEEYKELVPASSIVYEDEEI